MGHSAGLGKNHQLWGELLNSNVSDVNGTVSDVNGTGGGQQQRKMTSAGQGEAGKVESTLPPSLFPTTTTQWPHVSLSLHMVGQWHTGGCSGGPITPAMPNRAGCGSLSLIPDKRARQNEVWRAYHSGHQNVKWGRGWTYLCQVGWL